MALKALMLRKKLSDKQKALEELRAKDAEFETRESEIAAAIEEAETDEEKEAVEEEMNKFEEEKTAHDKEADDLEEAIRGLEEELKAEEERQKESAPKKKESEETRMHENNVVMTKRDKLAQIAKDEMAKEYLSEIRSAIKEKRAITNVGLTIPEVMLDLLRENIEGYSKLYKYVKVRTVHGDGRQVIMGTIPEAIWLDCCGTLEELNLGFNDVEVGCWKVGGYFALCNANIEDSDVDLLSEVTTALGQAIGLALDRAIVYGTGTRQPEGVFTRLAQEEEPDDYPATARDWEDLHETNIIKIDETGLEMFKAIVTASAASKGKYARGTRVWVMNETTKAKVMAEAMTTDAGGAIVSGVNNTMPVVGGTIETLEFIPDNVIIAGYFEDYLLAERAGKKFATSEHVKFLQDQTVVKGTARYDGKPSIAEAFVALGLGVTPAAPQGE